ncbi:hypothetical protein MHYP_G00255020 [Metynnis hypsauchen]
MAPTNRNQQRFFFPNIWEKEHKTVKSPPKKPRPTEFPPRPVKGEAVNSLVCQGIIIKAGETLADEAVSKKPQPMRSSRKPIFIQAAAPVLSPQESSLDVTVQGVAIPLNVRFNTAGNEDMKIHPAPPPSPVLKPSPPPQPCPHCARQWAAPASRPRVQNGLQRTFRPMPYTWSNWCS